MKIIFTVEAPPNSAQSSPPGYPHEWEKFLSEVKRLSSAGKVTQLIRGTWVLDANGGLPFVLEAAKLATDAKLPYKALLLEEYTELTSSKGPGMKISAEALRQANSF